MKDLSELYRYKYDKPVRNSSLGLTDQQKLCLDMFILIPEKKFWEIFVMVNPDTGWSRRKIQDEANQLLTLYDSEVYLKDRKNQLDKFFGLIKADEGDMFDIELDEIPNNAEEILMKKAWKEIESKGLDSKAAELWFRKLLSAKEEDSDVAPPLRILAESCHSCRYKAACEVHLYDGCKHCKYKKYANKNGVSYTYKDQLDLPKNFYEKNKIKQENNNIKTEKDGI